MPKQIHSPVRTYSITSGKGGVGKTVTTISLALIAKRNGKRILILDGDLGLANIDVVLGIRGRYNIRDVLDGTVSLRDVIIEGPLGIDIIPSGSGISSLTALSPAQRQILLEQTEDIKKNYDLVLIDTGAGISDVVMNFNAAADDVIVVTTPEPHAMTDAYALIKVLSEKVRNPRVHLLINQSRSSDEALKVHSRISEVAMRFLKVDICLLGHVPYDTEVPMRVLKRNLAVTSISHTIAGQAWAQIGQKLFGNGQNSVVQRYPESDLWHRLMNGSTAFRPTLSI